MRLALDELLYWIRWYQFILNLNATIHSIQKTILRKAQFTYGLQ